MRPVAVGLVGFPLFCTHFILWTGPKFISCRFRAPNFWCPTFDCKLRFLVKGAKDCLKSERLVNIHNFNRLALQPGLLKDGRTAWRERTTGKKSKDCLKQRKTSQKSQLK